MFMRHINKSNNLRFCLLTVVWGFVNTVLAEDLKKFSLQDLLAIDVVTPTRKNLSAAEAPANLTIITRELIARRGYKNLFEVFVDIPGFDFSTYEDGGGEYPSHSFLRGIGGGPGNSKLMIMIDGIVQNHIAFNWSMGWSDAQMLHNIERIELVQGPASVLYGANAMSGIVHLITKKNTNEAIVQLGYGQGNTRAVNLHYSHSDSHWDLAFAAKVYNSDGDKGIGRADPGGYFSDNYQPNVILKNYDGDDNFITHMANPNAGQALPDGFNTSKEDWSIGGHIFYQPAQASGTSLKRVGIAANIADNQDGLASYTTGYEYLATDDKHLVHQRNAYIYSEAEFRLANKANLKARLWHRENQQLPDTAFRYSYQFPLLAKSYHSVSSQTGVEGQMDFTFANENSLTVGGRYLDSDKSNQIISLGQQGNINDDFTLNSWLLATTELEPQLHQFEQAITKNIKEAAVYGEYSQRLSHIFSYFIGLRFDDSDSYGRNSTPNFALITHMPVDQWQLPFSRWTTKLLLGKGFREPSVFEQYDEFRGNEELSPETSKTAELLNEFHWLGTKPDVFDVMKLTISMFYTELEDTIALVDNPLSASGRSYANVGSQKVRGLSAQLDAELSAALSFYLNYQFIQQNDSLAGWRPIDNTAHIKWNGGINWLTLGEQLNINLRMNYVGRRKAPALNSYFDDYAPSYQLVNLVLTWQPKWLSRHQFAVKPQLVIKNLFDRDWYGLGRQGGASDKSLLDLDANPNPPGFSPPYHPQYGRVWMFNIKVDF